jgi:hypothetical protein
MAMYALVSPGGSPGVTTTALALALTWPRPVIVAECDPSGGAILSGLFAGHLPAPRGLLGVALDAGRGAGTIAGELSGYLAPLDDSGSRMFLAGVVDPRQAPGLAPSWPVIAAALAGQKADVIADCGRLDAGHGQPASVLAQALAVVMIMRPSLRQIAAARPRAELAWSLTGGNGRLGVLLIGNRRRGAGDRGHAAGEISKVLGVPVIGSLPDDARTAAVLSDGAGRRSGLSGRPLMRAARTAGLAMSQAAARTAPLGATPPVAGSPPAVVSTSAAGVAAGDTS